MKPVIAWMMAALVLLGCAGGDRRADDAAIGVVTFNLYHDKAHWPKRLPLILDGLRRLDPDVIVLQEVLQHADLPNQAQTIADALGYTAYFVSNDAADAVRRYGNAILTRDPVLERSWRPLAPLDDYRSVAHVRVELQGMPVNVYATHLHHTEEGAAIRERQLRDVLAHVDATAGDAPSLLAGDFNSAATSPGLRVLDARFVDAYGALHSQADAGDAPTTTLNPAFFDYRARIDHVFAERGRFDLLEARVILDAAGADGTWPSDHFGLYVRLRPRR